MIGQYNSKYHRLVSSLGSIFIPVLLLLMFAGSKTRQSSPFHWQLDTNIQKLSSIFKSGDDHAAIKLDKIKPQVGKYRKRYKQLHDSGISFERFARRIVKRYYFPTSVPAYQKPHFASVIHTFLYRLACF